MDDYQDYIPGLTDEDVNYRAKIRAIKRWKQFKYHKFDLTYIESIERLWKQYGSLKPKQKQAIDNIIHKFRIRIEEWI